jgi:hypothetical protein
MRVMMRLVAGVSVILGVCTMGVAETPTLDTDARPTGTEVLVYELHGGTWHDAEKDFADGGYEDGFMCWAAAASNMLAWGGWGEAGELADEDAIFEHYQDHWKSVGGDPYYAIRWWMLGGMEDSGARKAPGGGGFYPEARPRDYLRNSNLRTRLVPERLRDYARLGYVSGVRVAHPEIEFWHSITCWGVNVDPETDKVLGIWITDSDDDPMGAPPRENYLRYFEIKAIDGRTHVQGYANGKDAKSYYIDEVLGLAKKPDVIEPSPEPQAQALPTEPSGKSEPLTAAPRALPLRAIAGAALIVLGAGVVVVIMRSRKVQD